MSRPVPGPGDAFYLPAGTDDDGREVFTSTAHTLGPWSLTMQHMSPPSALAVRALETLHPREGSRLARVTVEVLGVVPPAPLTVRTSVLRPGRQIELLSAELLAPGADGTLRAVVRAQGWRMATADTTDVVTTVEEPMPPPEQGEHQELPDVWVPGYIDAIEWSWLSGSLDESGPGRAWGRPRIPLVAGEAPSALQQLFCVVDSANGVGSPLDVRSWTFLNTDLTVHLHRAPVGGWTGLEATTNLGPDGIGTCTAVVHDEQGPVGRSAQVLLVRRR